jgi:hypothetical protein
MKAKKINSSFDAIFGYGIRRRLSLKSKRRKEAPRVGEELLEIFTHKIVANQQMDKAVMRQFFNIVLAEFDQG